MRVVVRAPAIRGGGRGRRPAEEVEEAIGAHRDGRGQGRGVPEVEIGTWRRACSVAKFTRCRRRGKPTTSPKHVRIRPK
jgi:hypothetical protein